jgi:hypothetical protein
MYSNNIDHIYLSATTLNCTDHYKNAAGHHYLE